MSCFSLGKGLLRNVFFVTCSDVLWGPVVQRCAVFGRESWQALFSVLSWSLKLGPQGRPGDGPSPGSILLYPGPQSSILPLGKGSAPEFGCGSLGVVRAASPQCSFCTNPAPSSGVFYAVFEVCLQQAPSCWPLAQVMTASKGEGCLKKGLPAARSLIDWLVSCLPSHCWYDLAAVNTFPRDRVFIAYCLSVSPIIRPDYRIGMQIKAIRFYFLCDMLPAISEKPSR